MKAWQIILLLAVLIVASAAAVKKYSPDNGGSDSSTGHPDEERREAPNNGGRWQNRVDKTIPADAVMPYAGRYPLGYRLKYGNAIYEVSGSPIGKTWKGVS